MTGPDAAYLGRRAARGGAALVASRALGTAIGLVGTIALARLVGPGEFGAVAMVVSAMALARAFEEIGLGEAAVQRESIDDAQRSSLFWLNAAAGLLLAGAFALGAPLVARLLGDPGLTGYALALAPLFALSALGTQHHAWLRRHFRFRALATAGLVSVVVGTVAGLVAAIAGLGAWALVLQQLATAAALLASYGWQSGLVVTRPAIAPGLGPIVRQGLDLTATQCITSLTRNVETLLIGRFFGAVPAGLFDRAFQLVATPSYQLNQPLGGAVVPALSRLQHDPAAFRALFRAANATVVSFAFPLAAFMAAAAPAIVETVLGKEWSGATPILRALAPTGLMIALNGGIVWTYQSLGHTRRMLAWACFASTLLVVAAIVGISWGPVGVAIATSAARVAIRPLAVAWCFRGTPLRTRDLVEPTWRPAVAALAAGAATYALDPVELDPVLRLLAQMGIFAATGALVLAAIPGGIRHLMQLRTLLKATMKDQPKS